MVRRRPTEKSILDGHRRAAAPAHARADRARSRTGRRTCEVANLELLAAYQRLQERAPRAERADHRAAAGRARRRRAAARRRGRDQGQHRRRRRRDDERLDGRHAAARRRATRPSSRACATPRADLLCKTNLLEYAAGSVNPAFGMTFNPRDPSRTSGGSSSRLGGARRGRRVRLRARHRHRRLDPHPGRVLRDRRAEADATGSCRSTACSRSPHSLDHVGTLTRDGRADGGAARRARRAADRARDRSTGCDIGVLRRQVDDPDLTPGVRDARARGDRRARARRASSSSTSTCPSSTSSTRRSARSSSREAWDVHRALYEREARRLRARHARAARARRAGHRRRRTARALADKERVAAGFAARARRGRRARRADRRLSGAARGPAGRHARGRPRGPLHGAVQPGRARPAVSVPCGIAEGTLPAGLQLAAAVGDDALAALRRPRLRGGQHDEDRGLQLDAGRGVPASATTGSSCRSARSSSTPTSRSASTGSSPSASSVEAAEPLGVLVMPSLPYGLTPYFAAYPGSPTLRVETYQARCSATCSTRSPTRASGASCS